VGTGLAKSVTRWPGRADGQAVFAGHGAYVPGSGFIRVPQGTRVYVYSAFGEGLDNLEGLSIELGVGPAPVKVFGPGDFIPNYTLTPPKGLDIASSSITVNRATPLGELLEPNMGVVHWAACTVCR
jgi:hypothetical protein